MHIEKLSPMNYLIDDIGVDVVFIKDGRPFFVAPDLTIRANGLVFNIPFKAINLEMIECSENGASIPFNAVDVHSTFVEHYGDGTFKSHSKTVEE